MVQTIDVIRGLRDGLDPTYACTAHDGKAGHYALLRFDDDGRLSSREIVPASERSRIEAFTNNGAFRGSVRVDMRADDRLLPLRWNAACERLDTALLRRAKSDVELDTLSDLADTTRNMLENGGDSFRGVGGGLKSAFVHRETPGFHEYRGGLKDGLGRMTDLTKVTPKTPEWEARLDRVNRGLDEVERMLRPGVTTAELDRAFSSHMDVSRDAVYGRVVQHTGFEGNESSVSLDALQEFDHLRLGVAVGTAWGNDEPALVYRSVHAVESDPARKLRFRGSAIGTSTIARENDLVAVIRDVADEHGVTPSEDIVHGARASIRSLNGTTFGDALNAHFRGVAETHAMLRGLESRSQPSSVPQPQPAPPPRSEINADIANVDLRMFL